MILVFKIIYLLINLNHTEWYFSLNHISYHVLYYIWVVLRCGDNVKYLGFTFSSDQKDDNDYKIYFLN